MSERRVFRRVVGASIGTDRDVRRSIKRVIKLECGHGLTLLEGRLRSKSEKWRCRECEAQR